MSARTHLSLICALSALCVFSGLNARDARCDDPDNARGDLNKSMNDYYDALKANPNKSPATVKKLLNEKVLPAEQGVSKALVDKAKTGGPLSPNTPSTRMDGPKGKKKGRESLSDDEEEVSEPPQDSSPIDGSKVPDLLEFPGAPKVAKPPAKPGQLQQ